MEKQYGDKFNFRLFTRLALLLVICLIFQFSPRAASPPPTQPPKLEEIFHALAFKPRPLNETQNHHRRNVPDLNQSIPQEIGPGDLLLIEVPNDPEQSGQYLVSDSGTIEGRLFGQLNVNRLTIDEIKHLLNQVLEKFIRQPQIKISLINQLNQQVIIGGAVPRPGRYRLHPGDRLFDLLAESGLLQSTQIIESCSDVLNQAFPKKIMLFRDLKPVWLSLNAIDAAAGIVSPDLFLPLKNGDRIFVPGVIEQIMVTGAVNRPGYIPWQPGITVKQALVAAGGPTSGAHLSKLQLLKHQRTNWQVLDLRAWKNGWFNRHDNQLLKTLDPGDLLYLP